ncbi:MAG: peptidoglycan DD-metalloendopeptidase family protein [Hyphomonadaceae bacterium]
MAKGALRASVQIACAIGALATFLGPAGAQTTRTVSQVERDRRAETARAERLRSEANAARAEVRQLEQRLQQAGQRRAEADAALEAAVTRLTDLEQQIATDEQRQRRAQAALESAIIAAAFAERRADQRAVRAGIFARAATPQLAAEQRHARTRITGNRQLVAQVNEERTVLADAQSAIDAERGELVTMTAQRRARQNTLVRDASAAERRARQLASEARNLRELAQRVQRASTTPRRASGPNVIPAAWVAPTQGSIVRGYGVREGGAPATQGVLLRTRAGSSVVSPSAGEVAYAGVFRSYGNTLILNLDGGYALVLTGLDAINVRVGDRVRAGQTVGGMAASDTPAPELYVEVRREGQPVDPGRWLNARGLAAERSVQSG